MIGSRADQGLCAEASRGGVQLLIRLRDNAAVEARS